MDIFTLEDVPALQRFLGLVTYCTKFNPNLSSKANPLRELLSHVSSHTIVAN